MSKPLPSSLFLRSYLAIVLGILLIALALDSLLAVLLPEEENPSAAAWRGSFALIRQDLEGIPLGGLSQHFEHLRPEYEEALEVPVALYEKSDFAGLDDVGGAPSGAILSLYDTDNRETLYQEIPATPYLLAIGPLPARAGPARSTLELGLILTYYCLVAFIIYLWIRPFFRDLSSLRGAASEFGRDDFATRVVVPASSSILPVAQSFNTMAERIQYLISAHRELTNAVSHELRTPLARFKFSLEILANTGDAEKKRQYLQNMKGDVQELEALVDEMLSYARLSEANLQLHLVDVNLRTWLQEVVGQYDEDSVALQYSFATLDRDNGYFASFNPDLMARAIHNVLRNCLRYARNSIAISAHLTPTEAIVKICDDGPGIPSDKVESIFEPFSRLDTSRDRQSGGYGLGLAIARRILQRHGGDITVANSAPEGACFTLRWKR